MILNFKKNNQAYLNHFEATTWCEKMHLFPQHLKTYTYTWTSMQYAATPLLFYAKPLKMDGIHWVTCKWGHQAVWDVLKRPTFVHLGKRWWAFPNSPNFLSWQQRHCGYLLNSSRGGTNSESLWGKSLRPPPLFDFKAPVTQQSPAGGYTACGHFTWRISVLAYEYYN